MVVLGLTVAAALAHHGSVHGHSQRLDLFEYLWSDRV